MKRIQKGLLFIIAVFSGLLFSSCCNDKITIISSFSVSVYENKIGVLIETKEEVLRKIDSLGLCIGLKKLPTINDSIVGLKMKKDSVFFDIRDVAPGKTYYVRAFAKIKECIYYSNELIFAVDVDDNYYPAVMIEDQVWFRGNLKTTRFSNMDSICFVKNKDHWSIQEEPAYTACSDSELCKGQHGYYYNWFSVHDSRGVCPEGWRVPSDSDWEKLEVFLQNNGYNYDGSVDTNSSRVNNNKLAKALSFNQLWDTSRVIGSPGNNDYEHLRNRSGFTAMPVGYRAIDTQIFDLIYKATYFWTATEKSDSTENAYYRLIKHNSPAIIRSFLPKTYGFSVRCVK